MAAGYPMYLHYLGKEVYGIWLLIAVVISFAQLGNLGIGSALTKLVAEEFSLQRFDEIRKHSSTAIVTLCGIGVITTLASAAAAPAIALVLVPGEGHRTTVTALLPWVVALSAYMFVVEANNAVLSGLGRIDQSALIASLNQTASLALAFVLLRRGMGLYAMLIASFLANLVANFVNAIAVRRTLRGRGRAARSGERLPRWCAASFRKLLGIGSGLTATTLLSILMNPLNKIIVSRLAGIGAVPTYEIAMNSSLRLRSLLEAGVRAIMPEVSATSSLPGEARARRVKELMTKAQRALILIAFPGSLLLILLAGRLLEIWLGAQATGDMVLAFRVCIAGAFLSLLGTPSYYSLVGLGKIGEVVQANVAQSGFNVACCAILLLAYPSGVSVSMVAGCGAIGLSAGSAFLFWRNQVAIRRIACCSS